jgi:hypothetical protein
MTIQIPTILRAREFHLYTADGKRLVDLWQAGGQAIFGHKPSNMLRELKNNAERGLFAAFPHPLQARFLKALAQLFPDCQFRVYTDEISLRHALNSAGLPNDGAFSDPAVSSAVGMISLWRPFIPCPPSPLLVPVFPCFLSPKVLVMKTDAFGICLPSETIAPVILAAVTRSIYDLLAEKDIASREAVRTGVWHRKGIYLHYSESLIEDAYAGLFYQFLSEGFLLPPSQEQPAILPAVLSAREKAKLEALLY